MPGDALQTFENITSPNRGNLGEILTVFLKKYVKPQSMATAKNNFQHLVFNPANQKLIEFLDELQKLAKYAFGIAAQTINEQFINAKMPPHLKKSINQAHLENGTFEQIVTHLERELELNSLETLMKLRWTLWRTNNDLRATKIMPEISIVTQTTLTATISKMTENPELSTLSVRHVATRTTPQRDVMSNPMHQTGDFPGKANREDRLDLKNRTHKTWYLTVPRLQPNL